MSKLFDTNGRKFAVVDLTAWNIDSFDLLGFSNNRHTYSMYVRNKEQAEAVKRALELALKQAEEAIEFFD